MVPLFYNKYFCILFNFCRDLIQTLLLIKKTPYLISGGFHCLIRPVARELGIQKEHVFANKLKFFYDGSYAGFDEEQPTSRSGGKSDVIKKLQDDFGHSKIIMVGDGVTDLEACPPADAFIGNFILRNPTGSEISSV